MRLPAWVADVPTSHLVAGAGVLWISSLLLAVAIAPPPSTSVATRAGAAVVGVAIVGTVLATWRGVAAEVRLQELREGEVEP